jgi:outer membrane lipoprotein
VSTVRPVPGLGLLAGVVLGLAACATPLPTAVTAPAQGDPGVAAVRLDPSRYLGTAVRWGGTIARVDNRADATEVEVVSRPLEGGGRPREVDRSEGRFIARMPGFLDPAIYASGRALTVAATVEGGVTRPIGEFPYRFPVVRATAWHLWEPLAEPVPRPWPGGFWYPSPFWPGPCRWHPAYCW